MSFLFLGLKTDNLFSESVDIFVQILKVLEHLQSLRALPLSFVSVT